MIIILKPQATKADAQSILDRIEAEGLKPLYMPGIERTVLGAIGDERVLQKLNLASEPLVDEIKPILSKYKLVSRDIHVHDTVVSITNNAQEKSLTVGANQLAIIAGPCAVESHEQLLASGKIAKENGANALRAGAFKPRTSPYSFQGLGAEGVRILADVATELNLPSVSEITDVEYLDLMAQHIDVLQVGARNMQNYRLLQALGEIDKPILLKRGMSATIEELLLAAEYIYNAGNRRIILCERGIRTFETATRNTLDLNAVAFIKQKSHLPIIVDPSHGTGVRELIKPLAKAAIACGADGIIVECHHQPAQALSDGHQALNEADFRDLMRELNPIIEACGRSC